MAQSVFTFTSKNVVTLLMRMMDNDFKKNVGTYMLHSDRPSETHLGELSNHLYVREGEIGFRSALFGVEIVSRHKKEI